LLARKVFSLPGLANQKGPHMTTPPLKGPSVGIAAGDEHKPEAPTPLIDQEGVREAIEEVADDLRVLSLETADNRSTAKLSATLFRNALALEQALAVMSPRIEQKP
jgi:hypothetical protein